jgi:hypothetical protein
MTDKNVEKFSFSKVLNQHKDVVKELSQAQDDARRLGLGNINPLISTNQILSLRNAGVNLDEYFASPPGIKSIMWQQKV